METLGLKNVNIMNRNKFDTLEATEQDELYAVEVETYKNGDSWYRVYPDGWVEQGGKISVRGDGNVTVTLLKEMADNKYYANWISAKGSAGSGTGTRAADTLTTTTFRVLNLADATMLANWYVCGQGA